MGKSLLYVVATVVFAWIGAVSETAQAQFERGSVAFGAGSSFPAIVYRQLFDCLYNQAQGGGNPGAAGPLVKATSCVQFDGSGFGGEILYEGNEFWTYKMALRDNQPPDLTTSLRHYIPPSIPYTDSIIGICDIVPYQYESCLGYDGLQFIAGEDPVDAAEVAAWNAAGNPAKFGNIIQIPAAIGAVAIAFNGSDGTGAALNTLPPIPTDSWGNRTGSSGLNLSRNALCGIFSGHITQWNNAILTALNGGVLGTGNITVIFGRGGTNFLLTNALSAQCQFEFGPNNETDPTLVSYAFPWTDYADACPRPLAHGAISTNWPLHSPYATRPAYDQCGNAVANPGGGYFVPSLPSAYDYSGIYAGDDFSVSYNGNNLYQMYGAIGYLSPNYVLPVHVGGLKTANIQSQWDITASTGQFQPPTSQGAQTAMASAVPQFDNTSRISPLAWSLQGVVPNPVVPGAYPIAGFTWIEMYQCYANHANGNNGFIWFRTWLDYIYSSDNAHQILRDNGFAEIPGSWANEIYALLTDPAYGPAQHGNGGCTTIPGAY
jgi:phosphate transport system substrate-binding protein